jgi:hypothetical protein
MLLDNAAIKGTVNMVLRGPDGRVKAHKTIRNKVMNAGIAHIVGRMINPDQDGQHGKHDFPFMMRYMGIGTGTTKNLGSTSTQTNALNNRHSTYTSVFTTGFDLESGGFPGTEYRLQNEITVGARPLTPQDVADYDATSGSSNGALGTGQSSRTGRIDMGNFNYYDSSTHATAAAAHAAGATASNAYSTSARRWVINFEDMFFQYGVAGGTANSISLANTAKLPVQIGTGSTVNMFQGDLNAAGALQDDYTLFGTNATAEGTTYSETVGGGGATERAARINAFKDIFGFTAGFTNAFAGTSTAVLPAFPTSSVTRKEDVLTVQTHCQTSSNVLNGPVVGAGSYTSTPILGTVTGTPQHQGGTGSFVTATTGLGSPPEKLHHRARYENKKQGKRLVFIALFPPGCPYAVSGSPVEAPITEAGIFNAPSSTGIAQTMLCRTVFSVVTKQPEDSLQITWSIAFSDNTPAAA